MMNVVPDIFLSDLILNINRNTSVSIATSNRLNVFGRKINSSFSRDIRKDSRRVIYAVFCEELNKYIRSKLKFLMTSAAQNALNVIVPFTNNTYRCLMDHYDGRTVRTLFNRYNRYAFIYNMGVNDCSKINSVSPSNFFDDYHMGGSWPAACVVTYGKEKYVYMVIEVRGMIAIHSQVLKHLVETCTDPVKLFDDTMSIVDTLIAKVYSKYSDEKLEELKLSEDFDKIDRQRILCIIEDVIQDFKNGCNGIRNSEEMYDAISKNIVDTIYGNDAYKTMMRSSIFKNKLIEMKRKMETDSNSLFVKGYKFGASMCTGLVGAGFTFNTEGSFWEKDLNLVPGLAIKEGCTYVLRQDCGYQIEKLRLHSGRLMDPRSGDPFHAVGHHPNLCSDGKLCIGDGLRSEWHNFKGGSDMSSERLHEFIGKVIDALMVVNYDSSYFDSDWKIVETKITEKNSLDDQMNKAAEAAKTSARVRRVLD